MNLTTEDQKATTGLRIGIVATLALLVLAVLTGCGMSPRGYDALATKLEVVATDIESVRAEREAADLADNEWKFKLEWEQQTARVREWIALGEDNETTGTLDAKSEAEAEKAFKTMSDTMKAQGLWSDRQAESARRLRDTAKQLEALSIQAKQSQVIPLENNK